MITWSHSILYAVAGLIWAVAGSVAVVGWEVACWVRSYRRR